jgi:hypothetical protein
VNPFHEFGAPEANAHACVKCDRRQSAEPKKKSSSVSFHGILPRGSEPILASLSSVSALPDGARRLPHGHAMQDAALPCRAREAVTAVVRRGERTAERRPRCCAAGGAVGPARAMWPRDDRRAADLWSSRRQVSVPRVPSTAAQLGPALVVRRSYVPRQIWLDTRFMGNSVLCIYFGLFFIIFF